MTLRYFPSTFAVGTLLVVFFVQPFADVSAKTPNFPHLSANVVQRDDSNASTGRGVESDSTIDAKAANASDSNDSNNRSNQNENAEKADAAVKRDSAALESALWLRLERDERGVPQRLSTSIVRVEGQFRAADGETRSVAVDLIGAIHFAEPAYYQRLNEEFRRYETVVFELVAPKGADAAAVVAAERETKAQKSQKRFSLSPFDALSTIQQGLGDALGFVYQIDGVDYSAPNLKRGDADAEDFLLKLATSGDLSNFFANSSLESILNPSGARVEGWILACALAKNKRLALRRLVADELAATALSDAADDAPTKERETTLIHYRNQIAVDVLRQELESGKTKLAVFYGAAHLDDLTRRVEETLENSRRSEPRWISAWSMESPQK